MAADLTSPVAHDRRAPAAVQPGDGLRIDLFVAAIAFVVSFTSIRFSSGSYGSVEQWINLTNQMLAGKQDFLFSYGPLFWITGAASTPYNVFTYWTAVLFLSAANAYFWGLVAGLVHRGRAWPLFALAFLLLFGTVVFQPALWLWAFVTILHIDSAEREGRRTPRWIWIAMGLAAGLAFYLRFFYGLLAVITVVGWLVPRIVARRDWRGTWPFLGAVLVGYLLFGLAVLHDPANLLQYIVINSQLNFGNSVDMTLGVTEYLRTYLAILVLFAMLNWYLVRRYPELLLLVDGLFLLFFKLGMGRSDHLHGYFALSAATLLLVFLKDRSRLGRVSFVASVLLLALLQGTSIFPGAPRHHLLQTSIDFKVPYEERLQQIYPAFRLDDATRAAIGQDTVDVYPYYNEYVYANRLNYLRPPVFQNYMTLTPKLDAMNAKFFSSLGRPRFVLWTGGLACQSPTCNPFEGFDEKYALNEDPLTSTAILRNYHVVRKTSGRQEQPVLLLEQNEGYTPYAEDLLAKRPMEFGQWVKVPESAGGVVKLVPDLTFTLMGRLQNLFFRGSVLRVKYRFASGEVRDFRLNVLNAPSGIWVSPWLDKPDLTGQRVTTVMLESRGWNYLQPKFEARWVKVDIPGVRARKPAFDPLLDGQPSVGGETVASCDASIDTANGIVPLPARIESSGSLRVQGWLASSAPKGILADQVLVTLTDARGHRLYATTHRLQRQDVAAAFKQPALAASGFETVIDTSALQPGGFKLGLAGVRQGKLVQCSQFSVPLNVAPQ